MSKYSIEHSIKTLLDLDIDRSQQEGKFIPGFKIGYFEFYQKLDGYGAWENGWYVKGVVDAESAAIAINKFRSDLDEIVSKICIIGQAYADFYKESFLIYKINNDNSNVFYFRFTIECDPAGLHFGDNEEVCLEKISKLKNSKNVFRLLKECINTTGYIPQLLILFPALEAMSGYKEHYEDGVLRYKSFNKETMKEIVGEELYIELYDKSNGIRNKLIHGESVYTFDKSLNVPKDYVSAIYNKIIEYFNNKYGTTLSLDITNPRRNFHDNYKMCGTFLKCNDKSLIDLYKCCKDFEQYYKNNIPSEIYMTVDPIDNF